MQKVPPLNSMRASSRSSQWSSQPSSEQRNRLQYITTFCVHAVYQSAQVFQTTAQKLFSSSLLGSRSSGFCRPTDNMSAQPTFDSSQLLTSPTSSQRTPDTGFFTSFFLQLCSFPLLAACSCQRPHPRSRLCLVVSSFLRGTCASCPSSTSCP